ncbi:MAG: hypothetical protein JWR59_2504 [Brevundimonas sp.]|nr:hypothetical protein [Brevundimonas sp.]
MKEDLKLLVLEAINQAQRTELPSGFELIDPDELYEKIESIFNA